MFFYILNEQKSIIFKTFVEIFKDTKNASVYILNGRKKKQTGKIITSTKESILLGLNKTKHY